MEEIDSLKKVVRGTVLDDEASREHYASDGSIFQVKPQAVLLPANKEDIVGAVKWVAQKRSETGKEVYSITCRGKGSDQAGGALGEGLIIRFSGYMDLVEEVTDHSLTVQSGALCTTVENRLATRQLFMPAYPASQAFASIGGMVANNAGGEKTVKYGSTKDYVERLEVVLASGQTVEMRKYSADECAQKISAGGLEGEIYQKVRDVLEKNNAIIAAHKPKVNKVASGYNVWEVLGEDGSMDLTKLITGSQGTLGIVTDVTLKAVHKPSRSGLLVMFFNDLASAGKAIAASVKFDLSALEMVDRYVIAMMRTQDPDLVKAVVPDGMQDPAIVLLAEASADDPAIITETLNAFKDAVSGLASSTTLALEESVQNNLWKIRRAALVVLEHVPGNAKAVPFMEDVTVSPTLMPEYLDFVYQVLNKNNVQFSVYGHAGNGDLHIQPLIDLSDPAEAEKVYRIADAIFAKVAELGGVLAGEHNDGLMRSPYLAEVFGEDMYHIFQQIKTIFDPQNIFNPRQKVYATKEFAAQHLRHDYNVHPEAGDKQS